MPSISFILRKLDRNIIYKQVNNPSIEHIDSIILFKNCINIIENSILICDGNELMSLMDSSTFNVPLTIFSSYAPIESVDIKSVPNVNLIITNLQLVDLYDKLSNIIVNCEKWRHALFQATCDNNSIHHLISTSASIVDAQIFLLNSHYKVICSDTKHSFDDIVVQEMLKTGQLSNNNIQKRLELNGNTSFYLSQTKNIYYYKAIKYSEEVIATILVISKQIPNDIDYRDFLSTLSSLLRNILLYSDNSSIPNINACSDFCKYIIESSSFDLVNIENKIKLLPFSLQSFIYCICIQFDEKVDRSTIPYSYIVNQLEKIFPQTNITFYKDIFIVLHSQEERTLHGASIDYDIFSAFLVSYNAYAGISNSARNRLMIKTLYNFANDTIRIAKVLNQKGHSTRIYLYEDYSTYHIIDLCAQKFQQIYDHNDLIYLTHPAVIALYRYDKLHNSDLRDILFNFIISDGNITKTAKAMYMHRNTVINKINKIEEIIGIPLQGGILQFRFVISCLIIQYYEQYLKNITKL